MIVQDHSLVNEFPGHVELIQELNLSDNQFHAMYNQYHEVDRQVRRIEEGFESTSDAVLESMKRERLQLKDSLFARLQASV